MADIPYIPVPEQPRTTGQPILADPSAASAPWRAVAQVGQDIQGLGKMAFQHFERKQKLTDNAGIARVDIETKQLITTINDQVENEVDHKLWFNKDGSGIVQKGWDPYIQALPERLKEQGMSGEAIQTAMLRADARRSGHTDEVFVAQTTRGIELDYKALELNAMEYYRNGLEKHGDAEVDNIPGLADVEKKALKQKLKHGADYQVAEQDLRLSRTPDDFDAYIELLDATTGEGKDKRYSNYPMLEPKQREHLKGYAFSRKAEALRGIAVSERGFNNALSKGEDPSRYIQDAHAKGANPDTLEKMELAYLGATEQQRDSEAYLDLKKRLQTAHYRNFLLTDWKTPLKDRDISVEDRNALLDEIVDGKFHKSNTRELMDLWLDMYYQDAVSDGEFNLAGYDEKVDVSESQKKYISDMNVIYRRANITGVPPQSIAGIASDQLYDFFDWYRRVGEDNITPDVWKIKLNEYKTQIMGRVISEQAKSESDSGDLWGGF